MRFIKYHALGNDYIVIPADELKGDLSHKQIISICHRNYGVGSDGILLGPLKSKKADFRLRIYNPDGSEAEKSGNGLRIFSRFLWDENLVAQNPFTVETLGGTVSCQVDPNGRNVTVQMGTVSFNGEKIPVRGYSGEVLRKPIEVDGKFFEFCAATVGNLHCVILCDEPTPEMAKLYGPLIETDARFPNRTNVQFMKVMDRNNIKIEIWERGAGYTLASGSSSTASASIAKRLGLCDSDITVHMPGGKLEIHISDNFETRMRGPVVRICSGNIDDEIFQA